MGEDHLNAKASAEHVASAEARVQTELINVLYRLSSQVIYCNYPAAVATALLFWRHAPTELLLWWVGVSCVVNVVRNGVDWYYLRHQSRLDTRRWASIFVVFSVITGICWGSIGVLFFSPDDIVTVALLCVILTGAAGVAIAFLAVFPPAYTAFVVPTMLFLILRLWWQADLFSVGLGTMCLVGLGAFLVACRHLHRTLRTSVQLRFENMELIDQLTVEKMNAEHANVAKSKFLAAASHDLRQPLQALTLFVSTLNRQVHAPETRRTVNYINLSVQALESLFNKLLDISRLDAGVIHPEIRDFYLEEILEPLYNEYEAEAQKKGLLFKCEASDVVVTSDPHLLERIVRNYLSNAIRYTKQGHVSLHAWESDGTVHIEVADTGKGIPPEKQEEIYREFYQIENPERDRTKGLGLGLAIVDRLARLLGHPIGVNSTPGRGSVFSISVPVGNAAAAERYRAAALDTDSDDVAGMLVLVIDDEGSVRDSMDVLFTQWGCLPLLVSSEAEAIEQLRAHGRPPDAVIADYRLREERTGAQAIRRIHEEYGDEIPALIITGDTAPDRLREAAASGYKLLHKPVSPSRLRAFLSLNRVPRFNAENADTKGTVGKPRP